MNHVYQDTAMQAQAERLLRTTREYFAADFEQLTQRAEKPNRLRRLSALLPDPADWAWGGAHARPARKQRVRRRIARGQLWIPA
jgi:ribosomal protein L29